MPEEIDESREPWTTKQKLVVPDNNPVDRAVKAQARRSRDFHQSLSRETLPQGDKNLNLMLADIRRLTRMIEGASISAVCSGSTITVTLTWGA
jgi:hypothetical protein